MNLIAIWGVGVAIEVGSKSCSSCFRTLLKLLLQMLKCLFIVLGISHGDTKNNTNDIYESPFHQIRDTNSVVIVRL